VIRLEPDGEGRLHLPPLPWTNVIANDRFGCIISETALGSAWCDNSRENRLTPWSNDPVLDPPSEALYLRDEQTGAVASCLPGPVAGGGACEVRHGFGYTRYLRHLAAPTQLELETTVFVDRDRPVRLCRVRVTNTGTAARRLSLAAYSQLVLGGLAAQDGRLVVTSRDAASGALLAGNRSAGVFRDHVAFAAAVASTPLAAVHVTTDRAAFLGPSATPRARRHWPPRHWTAARAAAWSPVSRCRPCSRSRPDSRRRSRSCWARNAVKTARWRWCRRCRSPGRARKPGPGHATSGATAWAGCG
jgi:N,N'-diacetylchitobiose phosphorylase